MIVITYLLKSRLFCVGGLCLWPWLSQVMVAVSGTVVYVTTTLLALGWFPVYIIRHHGRFILLFCAESQLHFVIHPWEEVSGYARSHRCSRSVDLSSNEVTTQASTCSVYRNGHVTWILRLVGMDRDYSCNGAELIWERIVFFWLDLMLRSDYMISAR